MNISVLIWLILGVIFLIEHSGDIGSASGQGMSVSLIWIGVATLGIIIDLLLQYFINKRSFVNIIEGMLIIGFMFFIRFYIIV